MSKIKLSKVKENPENPRVIKDDKFAKLLKSIEEFPKMMELRPMVVNEDWFVLGGNMRRKALEELGFKEIPNSWVKEAKDLTEEEQKRFIIADNVGFGEWDWDELANQWSADDLDSWGMDLSFMKEEEIYTKKITSPKYEPKGEQPKIEDLVNYDKGNSLIKEIDEAEIDLEIKEFLKAAAARHDVFNYQKIADYYAHAPKEVQRLMEKSALVIIDFKDAIEGGYVELSKWVNEFYIDDHGE